MALQVPNAWDVCAHNFDELFADAHAFVVRAMRHGVDDGSLRCTFMREPTADAIYCMCHVYALHGWQLYVRKTRVAEWCIKWFPSRY